MKKYRKNKPCNSICDRVDPEKSDRFVEFISSDDFLLKIDPEIENYCDKAAAQSQCQSIGNTEE
jgi:hypothetical protein